MVAKSLYRLGRYAWRHTEKYLPKPLQRADIQYRSRLSPELQHGLSDLEILSRAKPNEGTAQTVDSKSLYGRGSLKVAFEYLRGLIGWLAESDYSLISYDHLSRHIRIGQEQEEFLRWIDQASERGERAILLQYDMDAHPEVTYRLLDLHLELAVPANVMILARKIFDWKLRRDGIVEYDDAYRLDFPKLEAFQRMGGVVGYHCNAFNRARGNDERALEIFHQDVEDLRKHLDIRFFSMHGGPVAEDGRCNATMRVESLLEELGLTWVHNGHSVFFHATWSDGGIIWPGYRNEASDPLDFVLSTGVGQRTRLLFHPQNYWDLENAYFDLPILNDQLWVTKTRKAIEAGGFNGQRYWMSRYCEARKSIERFDRLFEHPPDEAPIFINGLSRSGTTLLVSVFDAHPSGAMAYESYPHYLHVPSDDGVLTTEEFIHGYQCLMNYSEETAFKLLDRKPLRNFRTFAVVTKWTGMNTFEIGELLRAYLTTHHRITGPREALAIIAASARFKLHAKGAQFWGTKCQGNFEDYCALWPQARIIYIMRNGLDILASQKSVGSFNPDPKRLGHQWYNQYHNFQKFRKNNPQACCTIVRYEDIVRTPEETVRQLCKEIGLEYHPQMIRQHELETTLMRNPHGQLSVERVKQPIDQTAIDRWKTELSDADVSAFLRGCGGSGFFQNCGYDWKR